MRIEENNKNVKDKLEWGENDELEWEDKDELECRIRMN